MDVITGKSTNSINKTSQVPTFTNALAVMINCWDIQPWNVIVDNKINSWDIQPTAAHISGNQYRNLTGFKATQC
jgi:hypothetical protein